MSNPTALPTTDAKPSQAEAPEGKWLIATLFSQRPKAISRRFPPNLNLRTAVATTACLRGALAEKNATLPSCDVPKASSLRRGPSRLRQADESKCKCVFEHP